MNQNNETNLTVGNTFSTVEFFSEADVDELREMAAMESMPETAAIAKYELLRRGETL